MTLRTMHACAALVAACALAGCHDGAPVNAGASPAAAATLTPRAVVTVDGTSATVTIAVATQGAVGTVGSVTGRLVYDSTAMQFDSEGVIGDGTLRATNGTAAGVVRFASASPHGIDLSQVAQFRFHLARAGAIGPVAISLEEVHETSRANLSASARRSTAVEIRR